MVSCGDRVGLRRPRLRRDLARSDWRCAQQLAHLVRLEQAGDAEEVHLLVRADVHLALVAELAAVEEHPVEAGLRAERLERQPLLLVGRRLPGLRLGEQVVLGGEDVGLVGDRPAEHVVALDLHLGGEARAACGTDGRNTDAVSPRARARTNRPTAWAKNSGVEVVVA